MTITSIYEQIGMKNVNNIHNKLPKELADIFKGKAMQDLEEKAWK
jgi:hypothetical protein